MTLVIFTKIAAGPTFGPYLPGDVVDINATDLAHMQAGTEPTGIGAAAVVLAPVTAKATKKGT